MQSIGTPYQSLSIPYQLLEKHGLSSLDEPFISQLNTRLFDAGELAAQVGAFSRFCKQDPKKCARLFNIVRLSADFEAIQTAAANALSILGGASVSLSGEKFLKVRVQGARLDHTILDQTDFSDSDLRRVDFTGSYLSKTIFTGCRMDGVQMGQRPDLFVSPESCFSLSSDARWVFIADNEENELAIWDVEKRTKTLLREQYVRELHDYQEVRYASLSPDGKSVVLGNNKGKFLFQSLDPVVETQGWQTPSEHHVICSVALAPDQRYVAWSDRFLYYQKHPDYSIHLYNLREKTHSLGLVGHTNRVNTLLFSSDGALLFSGSKDKTIRIWDMREQKEIKCLISDHASITALALHKDGKQLLSGDDEGKIYLWDLSTEEKQELKGSRTPVNCLAFSADGQLALSGGEDGAIFVWDLEKGSVAQTILAGPAPVYQLAFSQDGRTIISCQVGGVRYFNINPSEGKAISSPNHNTPGEFIMIDEHRILSIMEDSPLLRIWDTVQGRSSFLRGHASEIVHISASADGKTAVSMGQDSYCIWDLANLTLKKKIPRPYPENDFVSPGALSPNGKWLIFQEAKGNFPIIKAMTYLWNIEENRLEKLLGNGEIPKAASYSYTPDGRFLIIGLDGWRFLQIWDIQQNQDAGKLEGQKDIVPSVACTPDGCYALSVSHGSTLFSWNLQTKTREDRRKFRDTVLSVVVSNDGHYVLTGSVDSAVLWEFNRGKLKFLESLKGHPGPVQEVRFSPSGNYAYTMSVGHLRKWQLFDADHRLSLMLIWSSASPALFCDRVQFDDSTILSPENRELITTQQALFNKFAPDDFTENPDYHQGEADF